MKLIMLSPPGAGKGTHCALLAAAAGVAHVSSGELLRAEIAKGSDLGRQAQSCTAYGDLVPDDLVFAIMVPAVAGAVARTGGYLLDGFPRTLPQAERAAQIGIELNLTSDGVFCLSAPEDVLIRRLLKRARMKGRADDTPAVIAHRLSVFDRQTKPLVDYYRSRGILHEIDADRPVADVQSDIRSRLALE